MAVAVEKVDQIDEEKVMKGKILVRAMDLAGGVPDNFFKSTVVRVNKKAWRVNIWTTEDDGKFIPTIKIAHSFYIEE